MSPNCFPLLSPSVRFGLYASSARRAAARFRAAFEITLPLAAAIDRAYECVLTVTEIDMVERTITVC